MKPAKNNIVNLLIVGFISALILTFFFICCLNLYQTYKMVVETMSLLTYPRFGFPSLSFAFRLSPFAFKK